MSKAVSTTTTLARTRSRSSSMSPRSCLIIIVTAALALIACSRNTVYHHYEEAPVDGWERTDTLYFHVSPAKAAAVLHEEVELRINSQYPFMGLCLVVEQTVHHPQLTAHHSPVATTRIDTLNCSLIDSDGLVKGKGINYVQYHFHLTDLSVSEGDSLAIAVHHNMKREILPGFVDLGIKLVER